MVFARPWSFREYADFFYAPMVEEFKILSLKDVTPEWIASHAGRLNQPWKEYLRCGGFPWVVAHFRRHGMVSDELFGVYRDWILGTWSRQRTPERSQYALAQRLVETLNSRVGNEALRRGTDIQSANTVRTLLEMQEDHFALRVVPRFDPQKKKFLPAKLKKIYPLDPFVARVWASIGGDLRRLIDESLPELALSECAFQAQTYRYEGSSELSYLYSDATKSEVDFFWENRAFELKSRGRPTPKQRQLMSHAPLAFALSEETVPLAAYLVGEGSMELRRR